MLLNPFLSKCPYTGSSLPFSWRFYAGLAGFTLGRVAAGVSVSETLFSLKFERIGSRAYWYGIVGGMLGLLLGSQIDYRTCEESSGSITGGVKDFLVE